MNNIDELISIYDEFEHKSLIISVCNQLLLNELELI